MKTFRRRKQTTRYPWVSRKPDQPQVVKRYRIGHGAQQRIYHVLDNGQWVRPDAPRHERKAFNLSARQHRKISKRLRREGGEYDEG